MISRYLVIVLAMGAAAMRMYQHAWIESTGLFALAGGLIALQLVPRNPLFKRLAWAAFSITGLSMLVVFIRMRMS